MELSLFIVTLLGGMAIGIPIALALLVSGVFLMMYMDIFATEIIAQNLINGANNFSLMAIPFFMLAGELMNAGGISKRIIDLAMTLVGHIRGGLGYAAILASILFAGLSGSAVADTAALGAILIPMMVKSGYRRDRSTGLIATGGIIATTIPPSVPLIVFGVVGSVSITKLFMGGIVPGLMIGIALAITWWFSTRKDDYEVYPRKSIKEMLQAARHAIWAIFLPVIIVVGLRGGIFTPTEASVVAAAYAWFVGAVIYRELDMKALYQSLVESAKTASVVMFLVAAALVSSWMITTANIPSYITGLLEPFMSSPTLLMLAIILLVLLIGMVMDLTPTVLILTPVLMPIIKVAGIDPVYFGIVFILTCSIGMLTPPVGLVLNVAAGVGKLSMEKTVKGMLPFLIAELIVLIILILFPSVILVPLGWLS